MANLKRARGGRGGLNESFVLDCVLSDSAFSQLTFFHLICVEGEFQCLKDWKAFLDNPILVHSHISARNSIRIRRPSGSRELH